MLPLILIVLFTLDIFDVFSGNYDYPFGADSIGRYTIYSSKSTYIVHSILQIILLVTMIVLAFKKRWKWYFIFSIIVLLVIYLPNFFK